MPDRLLRPIDVCRELSIHRETLGKLVARGELRPTWIGSMRRFARAEVDAYLANPARRSPSGVDAPAPLARAGHPRRGPALPEGFRRAYPSLEGGTVTPTRAPTGGRISTAELAATRRQSRPTSRTHNSAPR